LEVGQVSAVSLFKVFHTNLLHELIVEIGAKHLELLLLEFKESACGYFGCLVDDPRQIDKIDHS